MGAHSGFITVNDANAIDAPQTIAVVVQIGSAIPDKLDFYVPPDGSGDAFHFKTNSQLSARPSTDNAQTWLSLGLDGAGSYTFVFPYRIVVQRLATMGVGDYGGNVSVTGSSFGPDNKTTRVVLHVTSQPIVFANPDKLSFRLLQGKAAISRIDLGNHGMGDVAIVGSPTSTADAGLSIAVSQSGVSTVSVSVDTGSLRAGLYGGSISIATNAANGSVVVPVQVEVISPGPPASSFQGVVNNATFEVGDPVSPGDLVAIFGEQLTNSEAAQASELPLPTQLGGTTVLVNEVPAPLFYSSYGQVNFQVPYETPPGEAHVRIYRNGQKGNTVSMQVVSIAPRLLLLGFGEYGLVVNQDGTYPVPLSLGIGHPAHVGDALVIYAIGLGATSPPVATGAAAPSLEPLARVTAPVKVLFGNRLLGAAIQVDPTYVGLTPGFVGLFQINVTIPPGTTPNDVVPINAIFGTGGEVSSQVRIAVE